MYAVTVEKGQRGRVGRFLNGNALAAINGHLASVDRRSRTREMWVWECQQACVKYQELTELIKQQVIKEYRVVSVIR
jgi:hypothetical protein